MHSEESNAHTHDVPLAGEDPPLADGSEPHPFYGPHMTAEQAFQARLQVWLQNNGAFGPIDGGNQDEDEPVTPDQQQVPLFILPTKGQVNYQAILRQQGVSFADGVVPSDNVSDSPLSAWNDNVSEGSSESSEDFGQLILVPAPVSLSISLSDTAGSHVATTFTINDANVPDLFCLARSVIFALQQPYIHHDSVLLQTPPLPLHLITWNSQSEGDANTSILLAPVRKVARKLWFEDTPTSSNFLFLVEDAEPFAHIPSSVVISDISDDDFVAQAEDNPLDHALVPSAPLVEHQVSPSRKRGRRAQSVTPLSTADVRRSPRSNKYMGFKVDQPSDSRGHKSLIKPRVTNAVEDPAPNSSSNDASSRSAPPPPTTIRYIQQLGSRFCGIPHEELAEDRLLAVGNISSDENDVGQ